MTFAGKHKAKPVGAALGLTKGGSEQVGIVLEIIEGEHTGKSITRYGSFSPAAEQYTLKDLRTCGWQGDNLADLTTVGGPGAPVVQVVIEQEEYPQGSGEWHDKVKFINAVGGGVGIATPLDTTQAKSFAERMRARVRAFDATTKQVAPPAPRPAARPNGPLSPEPPPYSPDDAPPEF